MDNKKKARMRRAQRMALRNGRQDRVFTVTYRDCLPTEGQRTVSRSFPEYPLPVLKDWRSGTDMRRLAEAQEGQSQTAEEDEISALLATHEPHSSFQE